MDGIQPTDIRAMREQGDMGAYLRQQITAGRARRTARPTTTEAPDPLGIPGEWPTGSHRPTPIPEAPPDAWEAALHRLRTGTQAGTRCECPGCDPRAGSHPDAA